MPRAKPTRAKSNRRRRSSIQVIDEKEVRPTGKTVPVKPARRRRDKDELLPEPALDRRRQIVGSDELPKRARNC